jgi:hypothetical protein
MSMSNKLYIIGNGFDLYHGIPSNYLDFGRYLRKVDQATYRELETYFSVDDAFWWEFEARLADFDVERAIDYASQFLMSYAAENWSDSGHHDYQYELNRVVEAISSNMRARFADWIRQLRIPPAGSFAGKLLPLDPSARYLNFNYTPTLQKTYGVDDIQVLHIHGQANNSTDQLVLGHAWQRTQVDSLNYGTDFADADIRVVEGNRIVDHYFSSTFKPTNTIIKQQQAFFDNLSSVRQILVMGHSLSEVDAPYLEEIINCIDASTVTWKVSYYNDPTIPQTRMFDLGIDSNLVSFTRLVDF